MQHFICVYQYEFVGFKGDTITTLISELYSIQHYVIVCRSAHQCFLQALLFSPPIKLTTMI
jgi:hypothetical protein